MTRVLRSLAVPIVVAIAVVGALVGVSVVRADSVPDLPPIAPAELVASVLAVDPSEATSGRVVSNIDLGLPELPPSVGGGIGGPVTNVIGEQHYRVWRSLDGLRIAHVMPMSEQVFVANRDEVWWWSSDGMEAIRLGAPRAPSPLMDAWLGSSPRAAMRGADVVAVARSALRALVPWAEVRSDTVATVAGRPAYVLTLTPRSDLTLIGSVELSIDAATRIPLRLDLVPSDGDRPAVTIAFTDVSFDPIDPATFDFAPPPGARVREDGNVAPVLRGSADRAATGGHPAIRVFGAGFELRIARRLDRPLPPAVAQLLPYEGPLASMLAIDRPSGTWVLAGPVPPATLRGDAVSLP
jgi:outer membrane lipoprotein-sorting protein